MQMNMLRRCAALLFAAGAVDAAAAAPACTGATEPAVATADLYARMTARDDCLLQYIPANGFDEIDTQGRHHHLDGNAFRQLFASPARIDFRAEDVQIKASRDDAIVTGVRVGSVTAPGVSTPDEHAAFTMVWSRAGQGWQLLHVHLSTVAAGSQG